MLGHKTTRCSTLHHTKNLFHSFRRHNFWGVVQMTVCVGCCVKTWMSKPLLNLLHRHAVFQQQRCTGVTEVVQMNLSQAVLFKHQFEVIREIVWLYKFSRRFAANVAIIFLWIGLAAKLAVTLLLFLFFKQHCFNMKNKWHSSVTWLIFELVFDNQLILSVIIESFCNLVFNGNSFVLKVNGVPFYTNSKSTYRQNPFSAGNAFYSFFRQWADSIAKSVNDLLKCLKHFIFKTTFSDLFPYLLNWVHFRCIWRNKNKFDIFRYS